MKKLLMVLVVVLASAVATPPAAEASILREAGRGCLIGGTVLGGSTYLGLTRQLITGAPVLSGYSILLNNAVIGCGFGAAGFAVGSIWAGIFDLIF